MTPVEFFQEFVKKNWQEFQCNTGDRRIGFNAAVTAFHMSDYMFEYYKDKEPKILWFAETRAEYIRGLCHETPDFQHIQSIANAFKHLKTQEKPWVTVASAGAIGLGTMLPDAAVERGTYDEEGVLHINVKVEDLERVVEFETKQGETYLLEEVLEPVIEMWAAAICDVSQ